LSQDGHLQATIALLRDERFWRSELGTPPPSIRGLGRAKLVEIAAAAGDARASSDAGGGLVGPPPVDDVRSVLA
jgi:hypothetical protein